MADIDVVRKRSSVWPWIIAIIIIAAVLFFLFGMRGSREMTQAQPASELAMPAVAIALQT